MKRSEMLLKMQRYHGTQWCMVEGGYITLTEFYDNMLKMQVELGMMPTYSINREHWIWDRTANGGNGGEMLVDDIQVRYGWELE